MKTKEELDAIAYQMKLDILNMVYHAGKKGAHLGGSLSCVEILAVLYGSIMKYRPDEPFWEQRDRFIISKAHGALALYAALKQAGYLDQADIDGALQGESQFYEHPRMNVEKGLELSGGSLGQGLSFAVGSCLALQRKQNKQSQIYVLIGDGECNEGSVWEAAASVIHFDLRQITIIIDANELQFDGRTEEIMSAGKLADRWRSLGYDVTEVDGHQVRELTYALQKQAERPKVIIAHTVKGNGISFAENKVEWHSSFFTEELYQQAVEDLMQCRK